MHGKQFLELNQQSLRGGRIMAIAHQLGDEFLLPRNMAFALRDMLLSLRQVCL